MDNEFGSLKNLMVDNNHDSTSTVPPLVPGDGISQWLLCLVFGCSYGCVQACEAGHQNGLSND